MIEAVTVCVSYSDFLAWSLLWNKRHFERLIVVTDHGDKRTKALCEYHHIECFATDAFYNNDKAFDKSAAITEALTHLSCSDWVAQIDADVVLPPRTRGVLERAHLNPHHIYGIDRLMCKSFKDWICFVSQPEVQHASNIFVQANAFPLGVRISTMEDDGYTPIGYFQLWNPKHTGRIHYPGHGTAHRGDMQFARQWGRGERVLIPEIVAIHLESEDLPHMGANWRGRRTHRFGGEWCPPCDQYPR